MNAKTLKHAVTSFFTAMKTKNIVPIEHIVDDAKVLDKKVALITGGSGGIGYAIAKSFIESGCHVIITGTNAEKLKSCVEKLGDSAKGIQLNLNDLSDLDERVGEAVGCYGKIDILVNSAGVHSVKSMTDFFNTTQEEFDKIMQVNLKGTYFVSQKIAKYFVENKIKGHILNISSSTGGEPGWSAYRISKQAIENLTLGLAQKLSPYGIVVNGIAPGSTATNLLNYKDGDSIATRDNVIGRMVMPDEIASYAKMLVSDLGNMVVGETIYISGGRGKFDIR